jgi:hypothetical protein
MRVLAANLKLYNETRYISHHVSLDMDKIGNNGNYQIRSRTYFNKVATKFILGKITLIVLNYKRSTNLATLELCHNKQKSGLRLALINSSITI